MGGTFIVLSTEYSSLYFILPPPRWRRLAWLKDHLPNLLALVAFRLFFGVEDVQDPLRAFPLGCPRAALNAIPVPPQHDWMGESDLLVLYHPGRLLFRNQP